MSRIKNEMATRCELAMMGKVMECNTDEVPAMTAYILGAMGREDIETDNFIEEHIHKYGDTNAVKYIVCNTVEGMKQITYLLESTSDDEEESYPAPFAEDYGSGYPCAFCYVFNVDVEDFSEFGDCFFKKRADGFYHRVS